MSVEPLAQYLIRVSQRYNCKCKINKCYKNTSNNIECTEKTHEINEACLNYV